MITYHPVRKISMKVAPVCSTKTCAVKNEVCIPYQMMCSGAANHPHYSMISTPTMSFITPFGMVCALHLECVFVNYCDKESQASQVGSHGIEASYITVHSCDILVS